MAKKSLLPRGFKAEAERKSIALRKELNLLSYQPLCGFRLANHLGIKIYKPSDFFPKHFNIEELVGNAEKSSGWSALTMNTAKGNQIIIHNDLHSPVRQQSNLMHELSHILCEHKHIGYQEDIKLPSLMREYNAQNEEEANFLGSTLQITREGLLWNLKQKKSKEEIAKYYTSSVSMVNFRINSTGVLRQLKYLN